MNVAVMFSDFAFVPFLRQGAFLLSSLIDKVLFLLLATIWFLQDVRELILTSVDAFLLLLSQETFGSRPLIKTLTVLVPAEIQLLVVVHELDMVSVGVSVLILGQESSASRLYIKTLGVLMWVFYLIRFRCEFALELCTKVIASLLVRISLSCPSEIKCSS
ncbi:unnamed protein product [Cylicostephanus goldi]|uniref:Uncharacterized protein n=1 Tax=Cylicostephanus goldi TaxID=71465 RepID=A0A3P6V0W7_CYLGO|nr:unnamed protein product [Cylicostephanus goldi]